MKKILWGLLALILFVGCFSNVSAVTTDTEGPTVSKMSIADKKDVYSPGDRVYLNTDLTDEVSGYNRGYFDVDRIVNPLDSNLSGNFEMTMEGPAIKFDGERYYFEIPKSYRTGSYYVESLSFWDNNENRSWYYTADLIQQQREFYNAILEGTAGFGTTASSFEEFLSYRTSGFTPEITDISIRFNVDAGYEDKEAPVLDAYSLSKEVVTVGESVNIQLKVTDESKHVAIWVCFSNNSSINTHADDLKNPINVTYTPTIRESSGEVRIVAVILEDDFGNLSYYYTPEHLEDWSRSAYYDENATRKQKLNNVLSFEVVNNGDLDDTEPPVLKSVKLNKTDVPAPSIIRVELEATDNKKLGNESVVVFRHSEKDYVARLFRDEDNKYFGELEIDQYAELGEYELVQVYLDDYIGNDRFYFKDDNKYKTDDLELDVKFKVTSKFDPDVVTSTSASNLVSKIYDAKDGATIGIDASSDSVIKKEVFEAIKGTNKTIYIESNGIEWVFNGKDIKEPKDIVTTLGVYYDFDYEDKDLNELLDKALVLEFADNGELPGVATVRIKLDYTFRNYVGDKVYVYHYNEGKKDKGMFDEITGESVGQNENGWFEFKITHNSVYVLSTKKPEEKYIVENKEMVLLNKEYTGVKEIKKSNTLLYAIIGILIALLAIVIIIIIVVRKRKVTSK